MTEKQTGSTAGNQPLPPNLISRVEAIKMAGVHPRTLDYWRRTGKLTTYRERGFYVMIDADELARFLTTRPETDEQLGA